MPESRQSVDIESAPLAIPPPYMDPSNSQARKKMMRIRQESLSQMKPCIHCGANPEFQKANFPNDRVLVWPAQRPTNYIHQDSRQFISYVLIIAVVIFLLFAACKYLP